MGGVRPVIEPAAEEGTETPRGVVTRHPECQDTSAPGHWYCVTHERDFPNNISMHSHTSEGEHVLTWICHVHGPEVP